MNQSILKPTRSAPRLKQVEAPTPNASEKVIFGEPAVLYPVGIRVCFFFEYLAILTLKTFQGKYFTVESFGDQVKINCRHPYFLVEREWTCSAHKTSFCY